MLYDSGVCTCTHEWLVSALSHEWALRGSAERHIRVMATWLHCARLDAAFPTERSWAREQRHEAGVICWPHLNARGRALYAEDSVLGLLRNMIMKQCITFGKTKSMIVEITCANTVKKKRLAKAILRLTKANTSLKKA
jgi:hypothetical protein